MLIRGNGQMNRVSGQTWHLSMPCQCTQRNPSLCHHTGIAKSQTTLENTLGAMLKRN